MNFDYAAHIKDLGPIATLFSSTPFDARASLSGRMTTRNDMLGFTCNGMIDEFYVGSSENGGIVNNCGVVIALDSLTMTHPLEHLSCRTDLHFNSGMINGVHFDSSSFSLHYAQARGLLSMNGIVDSLYSIAISGVTSIQPNMYVFDVDTLRVSSGSYSWHNNDDIQFRLNSEETRMMHAEMVRANETISLSGGIHYSGNVDITAEVRNFDLAGLGAWFPGTDLSVAGHAFSGNANAALRFSGALSNPIFDLALTGDHVQYRQTHIGTVRGSITYKDMLADINITTLPLLQDTLPSLVVRGVLPVNLAFSNIEKRFLDLTQDHNIVSQGFNLALLDPLLAEFDNLTGTLTCNVTVGGTPSTPEFGGAISLRDAQFLFTPNNIPYLLNATLQPSGEHIILQDCLMRNVSSTEPGGEIHLTGSVSIKNYKISSFDVTTTGQLLIMSNATKKTGASLYGPLFTETDSDGLKLSGTLDRPFLSGKLFVREANLVFPPTNSITTSTQLALNHYIIDDTSKIKGDTTVIHISKFFSGNGFQETEPRQQEKSQAISLIDRLRYNLTIETQGTAAIKMIFTPATNEELYAELEGHASVINSQGTTNVYGDITVLPRSYYNFFHRFDANGTIKFVGPWDNPELKVIAKYEGRNTGSLVLDPSKEATTSSLETTTPLSDQRVIVLLDITGTRYEPKLSMSMKVQRPGTTGDENLVDWSGDVQSDAISFILTGKFRDDLSTGEQQNIASAVGSTAGSGLTSNYLSGILTDVLRREFPFIRTAEFSYAGGNPNVRVTGDVLHGRFQVGGNIQNEEGRSKFDPNVSYQVSIGDITNNRSLRNLFIELQRREANFNDDKKTYETRIYYRFSF